MKGKMKLEMDLVNFNAGSIDVGSPSHFVAIGWIC